MWKRSLMLVVFLTGCGGGESVYCVAKVRAEDQGQGVGDPGFYNPDLVGKTICWGSEVSASFCSERDGAAGSLDVYENGPEEYCSEHGFGVACGGGLFMASASDCPNAANDTDAAQ